MFPDHPHPRFSHLTLLHLNSVRIAEVDQKVRAASAPCPKEIPYKLYKYCPMVQRLLWNHMGWSVRIKSSPQSGQGQSLFLNRRRWCPPPPASSGASRSLMSKGRSFSPYWPKSWPNTSLETGRLLPSARKQLCQDFQGVWKTPHLGANPESKKRERTLPTHTDPSPTNLSSMSWTSSTSLSPSEPWLPSTCCSLRDHLGRWLEE